MSGKAATCVARLSIVRRSASAASPSRAARSVVPIALVASVTKSIDRGTRSPALAVSGAPGDSMAGELEERTPSDPAKYIARAPNATPAPKSASVRLMPTSASRLTPDITENDRVSKVGRVDSRAGYAYAFGSRTGRGPLVLMTITTKRGLQIIGLAAFVASGAVVESVGAQADPVTI